ncbi:Uncharacterised protein [Chlamydia abortus]|nr:Uncharacterised protein [Chlamydia abortus]SGA31938.1 Uncharacterised protein [Chlamydia abortus]SGA33707.1 Uncharacterised protein [Chlamydia abortus]
MFFEYSSFHLIASSKNLSLPILYLSIFFSANLFSILACVAIPAWSLPGTHKTSNPCNFLYLITVS